MLLLSSINLLLTHANNVPSTLPWPAENSTEVLWCCNRMVGFILPKSGRAMWDITEAGTRRTTLGISVLHSIKLLREWVVPSVVGRTKAGFLVLYSVAWFSGSQEEADSTDHLPGLGMLRTSFPMWTLPWLREGEQMRMIAAFPSMGIAVPVFMAARGSHLPLKLLFPFKCGADSPMDSRITWGEHRHTEVHGVWLCEPPLLGKIG